MTTQEFTFELKKRYGDKAELREDVERLIRYVPDDRKKQLLEKLVDEIEFYPKAPQVKKAIDSLNLNTNFGEKQYAYLCMNCKGKVPLDHEGAYCPYCRSWKSHTFIATEINERIDLVKEKHQADNVLAIPAKLPWVMDDKEQQQMKSMLSNRC